MIPRLLDNEREGINSPLFLFSGYSDKIDTYYNCRNKEEYDLHSSFKFGYDGRPVKDHQTLKRLKGIVMEFIVENTGDFNALVQKAKEEIDSAKPWETMAKYIDLVVKENPFTYENAFIAVVEAGSFYITAKYGELLWEFSMPRSRGVTCASRHELSISWEDFIPGTDIEYRREIYIPVRYCSFDGFKSAPSRMSLI